MLSKSCIYGIWAVLYLSSVKNRKYVPIREISDELKIPFHFLTKILQLLAKAEIVDSLRGARGGVQLNRPATQITLRDVIESIDGLGLFDDCVLGLPKCGNDNPCPLHAKWEGARKKIKKVCNETTFRDLSVKARNTKWINNQSVSGLEILFSAKDIDS